MLLRIAPLLALCAVSSVAHATAETWTRDLPTEYGWATTSALDLDGDLIVAGYASEPDLSNKRYTLSAISADGVSLYHVEQAFVAPMSTPSVREVIVDAAGIAWVMGKVRTGDGPSWLPFEKVFIARFTAATGALLSTWFAPTAYQGLRWGDLDVNSLGRVIATSYDMNTNYANVDAFNPNGTLAWTKSLYNYSKLAIAPAPGGEIVLAGGTTTFSGGLYNSEYAVLRYSNTGALKWSRVIDFAGGTDQAAAVVVNAAGDAFISGRSLRPSDAMTTSVSLVVTSLNRKGQTRWTSSTPLLNANVSNPASHTSDALGRIALLPSGDPVVLQADWSYTLSSTGSYLWSPANRVARIAAANGAIMWSARVNDMQADLKVDFFGNALIATTRRNSALEPIGAARLVALAGSNGALLVNLTASAATGFRELEVDPFSGTVFAVGSRIIRTLTPHGYKNHVVSFD